MDDGLSPSVFLGGIMAIVVACGCGKKLKAPEASAGRRVKCPACGAVLTVPQPVVAGAADDGYELMDDLAPPASPANLPPLRVLPKEGEGDTKPAPAARRIPQQSALYQAASRRVAQRDAAAEAGPKPLFNALGVDFTWAKLLVLLIVVGAIVGAPVWFFTFGPGAEVKVISVQTVEAVPLLRGLDTQEPYSLFTGTGNRALGVKCTKLKNQPVGVIADVNLVYSMGGGDALTLTRPDPNGKHMLIEADVSQGLMEGLAGVSNYKLRVGEGSFALAGVGGGATTQPTLLFARFDGGATIDMSGSSAMNYETLLPADAPPDAKKLEERHGGVASGTALYTGKGGLKGKLDFTSFYYLSGTPGTAGLSATGHVTRTTPDGAEVEYIYRGDTLEMKWPKGVGRAAWWSKGQFEQHQAMNPYAKVRVVLLCERPAGDAPQKLTFLGHELATINPAKASATAAKVAKSAPTPQPEEEEAAPAPGGFQEPLTGYLQLLADARKKAKGVASMSNLNQIAMAIGMYADQNGGKFPGTLYDLNSVMPIDGVLVNTRTGEKPGYIYEPPAASFGAVADPMRTPIVWEAKDGQKDPNGSILYADGHIESPLVP